MIQIQLTPSQLKQLLATPTLSASLTQELNKAAQRYQENLHKARALLAMADE